MIDTRAPFDLWDEVREAVEARVCRDVALVLVVRPRHILGMDVEIKQLVDHSDLQPPAHEHHRPLEVRSACREEGEGGGY